LYLFDEPQVDFVPQYTGRREIDERLRTEFLVDVPQLYRIGLVIHPLYRIAHALRRQVRSGQDVLDAVALREAVHGREESVILGCIDVRHA
jgi:hypothetical protein